MDKRRVARQLVKLAKEIVAAETFKCPERGNICAKELHSGVDRKVIDQVVNIIVSYARSLPTDDVASEMVKLRKKIDKELDKIQDKYAMSL